MDQSDRPAAPEITRGEAASPIGSDDRARTHARIALALAILHRDHRTAPTFGEMAGVAIREYEREG